MRGTNCRRNSRPRRRGEQVSKKNLRSSIDDFLKKEGIFEDARAQAIKEVVAWQRAKAKKKKKIPKRASRFC